MLIFSFDENKKSVKKHTHTHKVQLLSIYFTLWLFLFTRVVVSWFSYKILHLTNGYNFIYFFTKRMQRAIYSTNHANLLRVVWSCCTYQCPAIHVGDAACWNWKKSKIPFIRNTLTLKIVFFLTFFNQLTIWLCRREIRAVRLVAHSAERIITLSSEYNILINKFFFFLQQKRNTHKGLLFI